MCVDPLEQEPRGADPQRLVEVLLVVVHSEEDDLAGGLDRQQRHAQVEPAGAAQPDVAEDHVRCGFGDAGDRLVVRRRRTDYRDPVRELRKHRRQPVQHHLVVVHEEQPQRRPDGDAHGGRLGAARAPDVRPPQRSPSGPPAGVRPARVWMPRFSS